MTRRKHIKDYPMWIYINDQRNKINLDLTCKDGHWTATFADLKSVGSYSDVVTGIRDQVHAVVIQQMETQKAEQDHAVREAINA